MVRVLIEISGGLSQDTLADRCKILVAVLRFEKAVMGKSDGAIRGANSVKRC